MPTEPVEKSAGTGSFSRAGSLCRPPNARSSGRWRRSSQPRRYSIACSTGAACGLTDTRSGARRWWKDSAVMMLTSEADEAWWPPPFTPLGVFRTRLAWWTMLVASHRTRRWTASRTSISVSRAGTVVLMAARILPGAALPARCEELGQERRALVRQDAAVDLRAMVEARLGED